MKIYGQGVSPCFCSSAPHHRVIIVTNKSRHSIGRRQRITQQTKAPRKAVNRETRLSNAGKDKKVQPIHKDGMESLCKNKMIKGAMYRDGIVIFKTNDSRGIIQYLGRLRL